MVDSVSTPLQVMLGRVTAAALGVVVIDILIDGLEERAVLVRVAWVTAY